MCVIIIQCRVCMHLHLAAFSLHAPEMITLSLFPSGQQKSEEVSVEVDDYDDELEAFKK